MAHFLEDSQMETCLDADLLLVCKNSKPLITVRKEPTVRVLSPSLVAKHVCHLYNYRDELGALERAKVLGIRVPNVRRVVTEPDGRGHFLIMDRIDGLTLEQIWPTITLYDVVAVGLHLRQYVNAMRTDISQSSGGVYSGRTRSQWIECIYGPIPRATPHQFAQFLNWWLVDFKSSKYPPRPHLQVSTPPYHVLVHQDLAPRNMILDSQKNLWLVDWGHSGYYPEYMEGIGMDTTAMSWLEGHTWTAIWGRVKWGLLRLIVGFSYSSRGTLASGALSTVYNRSIRYKLLKTPYSESELCVS